MIEKLITATKNGFVCLTAPPENPSPAPRTTNISATQINGALSMKSLSTMVFIAFACSPRILYLGSSGVGFMSAVPSAVSPMIIILSLRAFIFSSRVAASPVLTMLS
ncbi:MAG: hypothetical protein BWY28_01632 [bacterium ADurb.Bin236]|nr:MAG: hypothetical protein BWY28_01632 [bacterium ADurb.Bin236]